MSKKPAKAKIRKLSLPLGIFDMDVQIVVCPQLDYFREYMRRNFGERSVRTMQNLNNHNTHGVCMVDVHGDCPIIWLQRVAYTPQDVATLVHEATHALINVFAFYGVPITEENDEVFAHAMGYLVRSIYRKFKSPRKRKTCKNSGKQRVE